LLNANESTKGQSEIFDSIQISVPVQIEAA